MIQYDLDIPEQTMICKACKQEVPISKMVNYRRIKPGKKTGTCVECRTAKAVARKLSSKTKPDGRRQRATAEKELWRLFSLYIRQRDAKERGKDGYVACITCGQVRHWKGMDAGHYVSRRHQATLYMFNNVHAQCKGCNGFPGMTNGVPDAAGRPIAYAQWIDSYYGEGTAAHIRMQARMKCRRSIQSIWGMTLTIKNLLATEGFES